jgi:hypothetical protein
MCWRAGPARSWFLTGIILPSKPQVWPILTRSVLMDLPVYCCAARLFGKTKNVFPRGGYAGQLFGFSLFLVISCKFLLGWHRVMKLK